MEQAIYGHEWPHYYADEADARLDLVAEVRTGAMHPTVAERKLRSLGIRCSRAAREDFRAARRAWLDETLPMPIASHPFPGTAEVVWDIIIPLAKGDYQHNLLCGREAWSGAGLRGTARLWGARYATSRRNLLRRIRDLAAKPEAWRIGQIERSGRVGLIFTDKHGSWSF